MYKANLSERQLLAREVTRQYIGYFQHDLKDILDKYDPLRGLI
ncbi:hypothetical protein [Halobacillus sp. B29]